jgi:DNA-binding transcriptional regulator YdaS (Cro superfamily)
MDDSAMRKAVKAAGSETKLAARIGFSQVAVNKAVRRGRVSAEMAVAIDLAQLDGVTKESLRPDLFGATRRRKQPRKTSSVRARA